MPGGNAVLDANVLIHSRGQFPYEKVLIPPSVNQEIKSEISQLKMEKLDLNVERPSEEFLEEIWEKSQEIFSPTSEQDEEALALALEKEVPLVTDDKALQNLALHLGADFETFNSERISEKRAWEKVCGNCGKEVSGDGCSRCGSTSLRRARRS
jgi:UPF0271 protein